MSNLDHGATTVSSRALGVLLDSWRASSAPGYLALADRIRLLVLDGRLPVGTRLPSERDLCAHLGVSRTTVAAAYAALRDSGHVDSVRGSGSVVRLPTRASLPRPATAEGLLDLTKAALPAADGIAEAAQRAAGRLGAYLGDSGYDQIGRPVLREAIAERYRRRGSRRAPTRSSSRSGRSTPSRCSRGCSWGGATAPSSRPPAIPTRSRRCGSPAHGSCRSA
nr:hypothetical protein GCM10025699_75530 [Microbacterium flavescens]